MVDQTDTTDVDTLVLFPVIPDCKINIITHNNTDLYLTIRNCEKRELINYKGHVRWEWIRSLIGEKTKFKLRVTRIDDCQLWIIIGWNDRHIFQKQHTHIYDLSGEPKTYDTPTIDSHFQKLQGYTDIWYKVDSAHKLYTKNDNMNPIDESYRSNNAIFWRSRVI